MGFDCTVPDKIHWNEIDVLLVSPGVPHHYPKPHVVVSAAIENGVAIDNDIGLFFRSVSSADWKKFESIPNELYSETNHTLCKCGLVENIILNKREKYTTLIILKRDMTDQCVSYLERNDFGNITIAWQWYLHHLT